MRRLTSDEEAALAVLRSYERGWCFGAGSSTSRIQSLDRFDAAIEGLVRKEMVRVEDTDYGPRYHAEAGCEEAN